MGRPRKNSDLKPVKTRIFEAFWELFAARSIEQITVQDIAGMAQCNRSTFYRHYADMQDLIEAVEDSLTPTELPSLVMGSLVDVEGDQRLSAYFVAEDQRFRRIALLLGPTGDPAFADRLRAAMIREWLHHLGVNSEAIELRQLMLFQFVSGGVFAMLGYWTEKAAHLQFEEFTRYFLRDIFGEIIPLLPAVLHASGPEELNASSTVAVALPGKILAQSDE